MMKNISLIFVLLLSTCLADELGKLTHGPMLGRQTDHSMGVWCRTSKPAEVYVQYGLQKNQLNLKSEKDISTLIRDNTARVFLKNLKPSTKYYYQVVIDGVAQGELATLRTLPSTEASKSEHNPKGLFNFRFEFGCGNNTGSPPVDGVLLPTYRTLIRKKLEEKLDFAILNGDFIYEEGREFSTKEWLASVNETVLPINLRISPAIAGVWQNYKIYMEVSEDLNRWHRHLPSYYSVDDHEILNDVYGSGTPGRVDREAVFRDPATQSWLDYIGWSNHRVDQGEIVFGKANLEKGASVITDKNANFSSIDLKKVSTLHIHWGKDAGKAFAKNVPLDDPNTGVYEIVEVINDHQIKVSPPFKEDSQSNYSIGKGTFSKMSVSNCDIFMLDSRTYREMHDTADPGKKGVSMLGKYQKKWLMEEMKQSKAEFFFVVSSVNFMVPHIGSNMPGKGLIANKDDAWTVFLDEREQLIKFWEKLDKPVFVLTGDLHNSFAIKVTDKIWEFASGPHNSNNHPLKFEGGRPVNGPFQYGPRPCFIRWSTAILNDVDKYQRRSPTYCVVQVNNVFNSPLKIGGERWVAYPIPQVIFQYHDGITGDLLYSESILANQKK